MILSFKAVSALFLYKNFKKRGKAGENPEVVFIASRNGFETDGIRNVSDRRRVGERERKTAVFEAISPLRKMRGRMGRRQRCGEERVNADESERVCNRKQDRF